MRGQRDENRESSERKREQGDGGEGNREKIEKGEKDVPREEKRLEIMEIGQKRTWKNGVRGILEEDREE